MQGEESIDMAPWSFDANWAIAHGSLETSVTVESPEYPIGESDTDDDSPPSSPLVLRPSRLDSAPCEIKTADSICLRLLDKKCSQRVKKDFQEELIVSFRKKYDILQIYVRSTARVFEVYYSHSPQSSNEYLCTVRCNSAERNEKLLQTTGIEYISEDRGDCFVGKLPEDIVTDGGSGDDDWVKIKVPEVGRSSLDKPNTNRVKNVQDLYEATAQITDVEPCSLLTIRFLSLQNKSHVYVDDVYVFAVPSESTDSANEAVVAGSSTGSSLMAMLLPALLQSARTGIGSCKENHASEEVLKDDKIESGLRKTDGLVVEYSKNQSERQYVNVLHAAPATSAEVLRPSSYQNTTTGTMIKMDGIDDGSAAGQVDQQSVNLQELDNDAAEFTEPQQPTSALNTKPEDTNDMLHYSLERALGQLISRVNRVEEICLRFEEKMLRPIETMESRIQHLEIQLQKLTENSLCHELPRCTRISAPVFSCSESSSKSFYEGNDCPPGVASESEKKIFLSDDTSNVFPSANCRPSLVVSAPEFTCGEDEDDDDDTSCIKPRETLSIDDALAAALSGFISATKTNPSDHSQTISGPSSLVDEKIDHCDKDESSRKKAQETPSAENYGREPSHFTQIRSILVPDFTSVENGDDEHLKYIHSSDLATAYENNEDHDAGMIPSSTQSKQSSTVVVSCDFNENEKMGDLGLTWNGNSPVVSTGLNKTCSLNLDSCDTVVLCESDTVNCSCEKGVSCHCPKAGDLVETCNHQICEETKPRDTNINDLDDQETMKQVLELDSGCKSVGPERYVAMEGSFEDDTSDNFESSCDSAVDYELPILDVEFTFNDCISTGSPLEALLDGVAELNTKPHSIHDGDDDDGSTEHIVVDIMDINETANLSPGNSLLVDLAVTFEDRSSNSERLDTLSSPINQEMIMSLI
ncbi:hypothetical protein F511_04587 [Dorcoceras hygrometricum]|uniref:Uncharacterized protein n=1 Tax=Dorcoceras hygrometricum TaxID=472368 RepID=A0A2Z7B1B9_9LAMI|nr:hypothetical protein F511_04587 [Dorcoceras hygrometricum]